MHGIEVKAVDLALVKPSKSKRKFNEDQIPASKKRKIGDHSYIEIDTKANSTSETVVIRHVKSIPVEVPIEKRHSKLQTRDKTIGLNVTKSIENGNAHQSSFIDDGTDLMTKHSANSNENQPSTSTVNTVAKIEFKVGEIVWARIKGYPHWPAKVTSFPSAKMAEVVWMNDYRKTKLYRTQLWKFLVHFDEFAKRFNDTVGLEKAAKEALVLYGQTIGAGLNFN